MENKVLEYVEYLKKTKGISLNTEMHRMYLMLHRLRSQI